MTVKVGANANSEARTANVTIIADGLTAVVPVTQAERNYSVMYNSQPKAPRLILRGLRSLDILSWIL